MISWPINGHAVVTVIHTDLRTEPFPVHFKTYELSMKGFTMSGLDDILLGSIFETESKVSEDVVLCRPVVANIDSCSELCQNVCCNELP